MQTSSFAKHARCPKRPAAVKPYLPPNVAHVTPFALGPVMPAERQALDQIVETADLIETPVGQYLLVPASPRLVAVLSEYGAEAEDREQDPDEPDPHADTTGGGRTSPLLDPTDADFESEEDAEPVEYLE